MANLTPVHPARQQGNETPQCAKRKGEETPQGAIRKGTPSAKRVCLREDAGSPKERNQLSFKRKREILSGSFILHSPLASQKQSKYSPFDQLLKISLKSNKRWLCIFSRKSPSVLSRPPLSLPPLSPLA